MSSVKEDVLSILDAADKNAYSVLMETHCEGIDYPDWDTFKDFLKRLHLAANKLGNLVGDLTDAERLVIEEYRDICFEVHDDVLSTWSAYCGNNEMKAVEDDKTIQVYRFFRVLKAQGGDKKSIDKIIDIYHRPRVGERYTLTLECVDPLKLSETLVRLRAGEIQSGVRMISESKNADASLAEAFTNALKKTIDAYQQSSSVESFNSILRTL